MENIVCMRTESLWQSPVATMTGVTLNLGKLHRSRAFLVVVRYVIDPRAHGKAPHQPRIAGFKSSDAA